MLLQGPNEIDVNFTFVTALYIVIATVFLWLMLWVACRWIISRDFAKSNTIALLICSLLMVILIPIVTGALVMVIGLPGELMVAIRDIFGGGGQNYVYGMAPIIAFLLFMVILKYIVGMDWKDTLWVALIGIFLLFLLYSLLPELDFLGVMGYT